MQAWQSEMNRTVRTAQETMTWSVERASDLALRHINEVAHAASWDLLCRIDARRRMRGPTHCHCPSSTPLFLMTTIWSMQWRALFGRWASVTWGVAHGFLAFKVASRRDLSTLEAHAQRLARNPSSPQEILEHLAQAQWHEHHTLQQMSTLLRRNDW